MIWLYRFILNLPFREIDKQEILKNFPELLKSPEKIDIFFYNHILLNMHNKNYEDFKKWISESSCENNTLNCYYYDCPYYDAEKIELDQYKNSLLHLMKIGGNSKVPKKSFYDLVKKVHKKSDIKRVILTDPYILEDVSENGDTGGYNNLKEYLQTLGLNKKSSFVLETNPSPMLHTKSKEKIFKNFIKKEFPEISFGHFKSKYKFHDRFYLVEDTSGLIKGVFGPSLNGLSTNTITLFGALEDKNTLDVMSKWFK